MSQYSQMQILKSDLSFHIFNHGNGFENLFLHEANYHYFLEKYALYGSPLAETFAYCLMPNHFHFVLRIRERELIESLMAGVAVVENFSKVRNFGKVLTNDDTAINRYISKQFSNLFSCYTQSFNKVYHRRGSLFIKNFKRELIADDAYLRNAIVYVHRNPVHHGFCADYLQWEHSSYGDVLNERKGLVDSSVVFDLFGGKESWINHHEKALVQFESYKLSKEMEL